MVPFNFLLERNEKEVEVKDLFETEKEGFESYRRIGHHHWTQFRPISTSREGEGSSRRDSVGARNARSESYLILSTINLLFIKRNKTLNSQVSVLKTLAMKRYLDLFWATL
jgi:hypothetical protein